MAVPSPCNRVSVFAALGVWAACVLGCSGGSSKSNVDATTAGTPSSAGATGGSDSEGGATSNGSGATGGAAGQTGNGAGGANGGTTGGAGGQAGNDTAARTDITSDILKNDNWTLSSDSIIKLPPGTTTYTGVLSGQGTLRLVTADASCTPSTFIITQQSTFTLPADRQVEVVTKAGPWPAMGYRLDIAGHNPPVLLIDPCVTFQIGTNTAADKNPNIIATSDSMNVTSVVNGEINLDNIQNDGVIALASMQFILLGEVSGSGSISELPNVWGGDSLRGPSSFSGVLALTTEHDFGSNHVSPGLLAAKAVINEGSWLVWSPPNNVLTVKQNIYEAAYGGDVNFHPIGNATIIMSGVYSHTDNSPHNSPNLDNPGLSDPSLNLAKVIYRQTMTVNGNDASYRGINIEAGGTVQWGDGTHARFFLPSAPSPAAVDPPLGKKNAYINLHSGGTLAFDYNGAVQLNVGITGGGGGPDKSGLPGTGNVTVMGTAGNDVTFAQAQDYNGTTTIGPGATLRLGTGKPVPLDYVTLTNGAKSVQHVGDYDGDSSLLTAESPRGDPADKIVNDGTLVVQNTTLAITLSHMSGGGKLVQAGPGNVTVLANSLRGGTWLEGGTMFAADDTALGTGDVQNDATLAANEPRTVRVLGNYRQGNHGRLRLTVPSPGTSAQLLVSGHAELGGVLEFVTGAGKASRGATLGGAARERRPERHIQLRRSDGIRARRAANGQHLLRNRGRKKARTGRGQTRRGAECWAAPARDHQFSMRLRLAVFGENRWSLARAPHKRHRPRDRARRGQGVQGRKSRLLEVRQDVSVNFVSLQPPPDCPHSAYGDVAALRGTLAIGGYGEPRDRRLERYDEGRAQPLGGGLRGRGYGPRRKTR
jgi:hypothetical protein